MPDSIFDLQQRRKAVERVYGEWNDIRRAIIAAKGARECSDVEAEQRATLCRTIDTQFEAIKIATREKFWGILTSEPSEKATVIDALWKERYGGEDAKVRIPDDGSSEPW